MSSRYGRSGFSWILPLLLLVPPAGNIAWTLSRDRLLERNPARKVEGSSSEIEVSRLRHLLFEKDRELQTLRFWTQIQERYKPLAAQVIPVADLSARRSSIWIWAPSLHGANPRTAVVHTSPQCLLGRVERVWEGVARVQTLADPYIRIRFRFGKAYEAWGILWGTGRTDGEGHPLLEIHHLGVEVAFQEDDPVVTDGGDGLFPGGIPIGTLVRATPSRSGGIAFKVRGFLPIEGIREAILLIDQARLEVRTALKQEPSE